MYKKNIFFFSIFIVISLLIGGCDKNMPRQIINPKIRTGEEITFFIAADPHHLSKSTYTEGKAFEWFLNSGDGKLLTYTDEIIDAFILDIKVKKPDVLIIPGDLTCNGERESHLEMVEKLKKIEEIGVPVYVIPGNHDIDNPWARHYTGDEMIRIDSISPDEFLELYSPFGYDEAIYRDKDSLSYLAAPSEDVWLLMVDTARYNRNKVRTAPEMGGEVKEGTLEWIRECCQLAKENEAEIIAVMHHSLMNHSEVVYENYTIDNSQEVVDLFLECGIQVTLSGHIHLQDIKSYGKGEDTVYDIATSCLVSYPNQYGILEFFPNNGYRYSTDRINMERYVKENNIRDENLVNFKDYTRDFFYRRSYDKYYDSLLEMSRFSDDEMKAISSTVASLNLKYFAGFRNENMEGAFNTEGFNILLNTAPFFVRSYVLSMFDDKYTDNNRIFVPLRWE